MTDVNRLPSRVGRNYIQAAVASRGVEALILAARPDYHSIVTHFLGDALTAEWPSAKTNGASAAVTVATSFLTCTSGTDSEGYAGQGYGLFWKGDNGVYMYSAQTIDTITTSKIEIGLTDSTADAGAVDTKATPTATADDFCVLVRDTADNTQLDNISAIDTVVTANKENIYTVVGGTYFVTEFRHQNDAVATFLNGQDAGRGSMQGGDLCTPWFFCQARTTSSRVLTVDYLYCIGPNGASVPW